MIVKRLFLVHWKDDEVHAFAEPLRDAGWQVDTAHADVVDALDRLRASAPDLVVLNLSREPRRGRQLAAAMAAEELLRHAPVVLVDADDEAAREVSAELPNVTTCDWPELPAHLAARLG
jgi:CheY-like chemotaxis protein